MVAPFTANFKETTTFGGRTSLGYNWASTWYRRDGIRQAKPFNVVLPCTTTARRVLRSSFSDPASYEDARNWDGSTIDSTLQTSVNNRCYSSFVGRCHAAKAELAVSLLELNKTADMMALRALQLRRMYQAVRRGDLNGFIKASQVDFTRRQKTSAKRAIKDVGSFWLETWWGWKPTIQDIQSLGEVLCSDPMVPQKIRGSAKETAVSQTTLITPRPNGQQEVKTIVREQVISKRSGAFVSVDNPNKVLLNQLGVINPLSWAWELTPWSAVVDWVGNIGQMVNSLSDFYGLTLTGGYTSTLSKYTIHHSAYGNTRTWVPLQPYPNGYWLDTPDWNVWSKENVSFQRGQGVVSPKLQFRVPGVFSNTRLATAVSLLTTFLR